MGGLLGNTGSIFTKAIIMSTNDPVNERKVRIKLESLASVSQSADDNEISKLPWAFLPAFGGKNAYAGLSPEYGDKVWVVAVSETEYLIINKVFESDDIPDELKNFEAIDNVYNHTIYPSLMSRRINLPLTDDSGKLKTAVEGDDFQPGANLTRWRKFDILMVNAKNVHGQENSAQKFLELRTNESNIFQMVDLGNAGFIPGAMGRNAGPHSQARQTDYRDLWIGPQINGAYWDHEKRPSVPNSSQYIRMATPNDSPPYKEGIKEPASGGSTRYDDRLIFGEHETSKTIADYQGYMQVLRHNQDYPSDISDGQESFVNTRKLISVIKDLMPKDDMQNQSFRLGQQMMLSNTDMKRRIELRSKKGNSLLLCDVDKDEKIILNSSKGQFLYMEDSNPNYQLTWLSSMKHSLVMCDNDVAPHLDNEHGFIRDQKHDPHQKLTDASSFICLYSGGGNRIWMSDGDKAKRIQITTAGGHDFMMSDTAKSDGAPSCGNEIQITHASGKQQIRIDPEGNIWISNTDKNVTIKTEKKLTLHAEDIDILATKDLNIKASNIDIQSAGTTTVTSATNNIIGKNNLDPGGPGAAGPAVAPPISPLVPTDGHLANGFKNAFVNSGFDTNGHTKFN